MTIKNKKKQYIFWRWDNLSEDKKENTENPYPLKEDGKVYATKSAGKSKNLENKELNK